MVRAPPIPSILLVCALILSLLTSISLPFLPALDITRATADGAGIPGLGGELRVRIWAPCEYPTGGDRECPHLGHGYQLDTLDPTNPTNPQVVFVGSSWTRGLAIHPVATAVAFIALVLSFSKKDSVAVFSPFISFLAALLTLLAFAVDIALFVYFKHQVKKFSIGNVTTSTAPGFWLTFVSLILLIASGIMSIISKRKEAGSYPAFSNQTSIWSRFRKN
ncbi:pali-domain-containing protein [Infundibulicybe gibba]|nr:pali-domain-containing protein [Infundibulicybe gibba]